MEGKNCWENKASNEWESTSCGWWTREGRKERRKVHTVTGIRLTIHGLSQCTLLSLKISIIIRERKRINQSSSNYPVIGNNICISDSFAGLLKLRLMVRFMHILLEWFTVGTSHVTLICVKQQYKRERERERNNDHILIQWNNKEKVNGFWLSNCTCKNWSTITKSCNR